MAHEDRSVFSSIEDRREWKRKPDALSPLNKVNCVEHPEDQVKDSVSASFNVWG